MLNTNYSWTPFRISALIALFVLSVISAVHAGGIKCDTSLKGFATLGAGTTGGGDADPILVTNIDQMRKACAGTDPAVIKVFGTIITGPAAILVGSNKSIIGLEGATIYGGLNMTYGTSNVIIRYLTIKGAGFGNLPEDAIAGRGTTNVWVDHCDLSDAGDELLAMTKGSDLITVSWTKFSYTDRRADRIASLIGASSADADLDRGKLRVTYHYNHFADFVTEGMARVRFAQAHFANNFYNSPGNKYVIGVGTEAQLLIENNVFLNVTNPITIRDNNTAAFVTESGNIYNNTVGDMFTGAIQGGATPFTKPPYKLDLVPASEVEELVLACANANAKAS